MFFRQRSAKLFNGTKVYPDDRVKFINSDNKECIGVVQYDVNNPKRLFFWNNHFNIEDYENAEKI